MSITPDSALVLKGRISDPTSGAAIAGCEIDALPLNADGTFGTAIAAAATTTNGFGLYTMNVGAASPTGRYVVKVRDPISGKTRYIFPAISMQVDMLYGSVDSEGNFNAPLPDLSIRTSQYRDASVTAVKMYLVGQQLLLGDGTEFNPALAFATDINSGIYQSGPNQIGFSADATKSFVVAPGQALFHSGTFDSGPPVYVPGAAFITDINTGFSNTAPDQISTITNGMESLRLTAGGLLVMSDAMSQSLDEALPKLTPYGSAPMQGIAVIRNEFTSTADDPPLKVYGFGNLTTSSPDIALRAGQYYQDQDPGSSVDSAYGRILFQPATGNPETNWGTKTSIESGSSTSTGYPEYLVLRIGAAGPVLGVDTYRAYTNRDFQVGQVLRLRDHTNFGSVPDVTHFSLSGTTNDAWNKSATTGLKLGYYDPLVDVPHHYMNFLIRGVPAMAMRVDDADTSGADARVSITARHTEFTKDMNTTNFISTLSRVSIYGDATHGGATFGLYGWSDTASTAPTLTLGRARQTMASASFPGANPIAGDKLGVIEFVKYNYPNFETAPGRAAIEAIWTGSGTYLRFDTPSLNMSLHPTSCLVLGNWYTGGGSLPGGDGPSLYLEPGVFGPSAPPSGGYLYIDSAGRLHYRGTTTNTVIAPA